MPSATRVLQDHTVLRCRSLDRLYLNAYIPELQRPELVKRFLEREATPIASPALFQTQSNAFVKSLRAYAEANGAPWILFERGERKEDRMRPLLEAASERLLPGLVAVGVAQERTTGWKGTKRPLDRGGFTFGFSRISVYVNQYYCYLWDADFGPGFIKLSAPRRPSTTPTISTSAAGSTTYPRSAPGARRSIPACWRTKRTPRRPGSTVPN